MPRPKTKAAEYARVTLRLPPPILEVLRQQADAIGRPINTHILYVLQDGLNVAQALLAQKPPRARALAR